MLHGYFDLPTFTFFNDENRNIWTGSLYRDFSYRITPVVRGKDDEQKSELHVYVWYGVQCFDKTDKFIAEYSEEYSPEGLEACINDLTQEFDKFKAVRKELDLH